MVGRTAIARHNHHRKRAVTHIFIHDFMGASLAQKIESSGEDFVSVRRQTILVEIYGALLRAPAPRKRRWRQLKKSWCCMRMAVIGEHCIGNILKTPLLNLVARGAYH